MVCIRWLQLLLASVLLGGCTFFFDVQDTVQQDSEPDSRQQQIIFDRIRKITKMMKGIDAFEISSIGPNEANSGPEKWTVCVRGTSGNELRYFTFFLKGETVASSRSAVINDRCEMRSYAKFEDER